MKKTKNWAKWIYWFTFAVAVIAVYKTLDNFGDITAWFARLISVLIPFLGGILVAYILYMPCKGIEKFLLKNKVFDKKARPISILIVYVITLLVIIFTINIIFPAISKSIIDLANNLPTYYSNAMDYIKNAPEDSFLKHDFVLTAMENLKKIDITKILNMENITDYINKAVGIASAIFSVFVTIVISIYILLERTEILKFIRKFNEAVFKRSTCKMLDRYFEKTNTIFFKFISSQILDGIIIGIIMSITFSIMKIKYAVLLGFMIGLFNIIPYFGAIISIIAATIITIFTGGFSKAIWMVIIATILQQIDANIINPKIVGSSLKISPLLVIFAVTIGGAYFGVLGMFLAVPIFTVLKILIEDYIDYKNRIKESKVNGNI